VFPNLRHLYWNLDYYEQNDHSEFKFQCTNFNTLQTLKIISNNFFGLNNIFNNLLNLENLHIDCFNFSPEKLQLNQLLNLKYMLIRCQDRMNPISLTIKNLKNLEFLYLEGFDLDDDCFDGLSNLEYLFLNDVKKFSFQNFNCLQKLIHLLIIQSDLSKLDLSIQNVCLPNLQYLYLMNNKIEVLKDGVFSGLKSLRRLDLSNNQLRKLNKNVFNGLDNLDDLDLSGNPLDDVGTTLIDLKFDLKLINDVISVHFN
jgi:Leucine-rich repeat (LRR) protein